MNKIYELGIFITSLVVFSLQAGPEDTCKLFSATKHKTTEFNLAERRGICQKCNVFFAKNSDAEAYQVACNQELTQEKIIRALALHSKAEIGRLDALPEEIKKPFLSALSALLDAPVIDRGKILNDLKHVSALIYSLQDRYLGDDSHSLHDVLGKRYSKNLKGADITNWNAYGVLKLQPDDLVGLNEAQINELVSKAYNDALLRHESDGKMAYNIRQAQLIIRDKQQRELYNAFLQGNGALKALALTKAHFAALQKASDVLNELVGRLAE